MNKRIPSKCYFEFVITAKMRKERTITSTKGVFTATKSPGNKQLGYTNTFAYINPIIWL